MTDGLLLDTHIVLWLDSGDDRLRESTRALIGRPGVEAAPLGHRAACHSYRLHHLEHRDPADRLLIATAIELVCPLLTYDERIQRFGEKHGRQYRFACRA